MTEIKRVVTISQPAKSMQQEKIIRGKTPPLHLLLRQRHRVVKRSSPALVHQSQVDGDHC